jgi:hypothetical protein
MFSLSGEEEELAAFSKHLAASVQSFLNPVILFLQPGHASGVGLCWGLQPFVTYYDAE